MSFCVNQKSRHNAQVIVDLNRHIDSLARVLEPISKMDTSEISPDLSTDIQALIGYAFVTTYNVFQSPAHYVHRELSLLAATWSERKLPGWLDHLFDKGTRGDEVHAFSEGVKRALGEFQVRVGLNFDEHPN